MKVFKHVPPQFPKSRPCKIAFVGEAPSDDEVLEGVPLIGPSGRVFDACLRAANLERTEYLVTNAFDEQAPDNDVVKYFMKDEALVKRNRERLAEEFAACEPDVIVPMGGVALWFLTGQMRIKQFRGAVTKATQLVPGTKLLPTYHPAAVLRGWHLLPTVTADFTKAYLEAEVGKNIVYPKVEILIEPSLKDFEWYAEQCLATDELTLDIETGWGMITSVQFGDTPNRAMSIPFVDLRKPNKSYWRTADDEFEAWKIVARLCASPVPKIGQNFVYDVSWLWKRGIAVRNYREDTRLRHKVQWPELGADLANMSATYTRVGGYKHWVNHHKDGKADG